MQVISNFLKFTGLDLVSFSPAKNREMDLKVQLLREQFPEPTLIERACRNNKPYIRVVLVSEVDELDNHRKVTQEMQVAAGSLPIEFEHITFRSISKLFARLEELAANH